MFSFDIKVVAEYPDLVDENNRLHAQAEEMRINEQNYLEEIGDLKKDISKREADQKEKSKQISGLQKDIASLQKNVKELKDKIKS